MGTSLCDATMTLKQQKKEKPFFLSRIHFSTGKSMFVTFTKIYTLDYTAAYTKSLVRRADSIIAYSNLTLIVPQS